MGLCWWRLKADSEEDVAEAIDENKLVGHGNKRSAESRIGKSTVQMNNLMKWW